MLGVDPEFGTSAFRLWVAAGSTALLFLLCVFALYQPRLRMALGPVRRAGVVIVGAVLGAAIAASLLVRPAPDDRAAGRRNLELRAAELDARALAPGSPLACLDALVGKSVEAACEKALFASPADVAAATSYVAARLVLLASMTAYAGQDDTNIDDLALPLRRSLEADRFGFVAHVLAVRDGCTAGSCEALAQLHDGTRVRANLAAETFDRAMEHYTALWNAAADKAVADATPPPSTAAETNPPAGPHKPVNIDFPTASSIPAVSIMNPEPSGPVLPGVAAAAAANPNPQAAAPAARHARKQTNSAAAPSPPQSASSASTTVEPIWPEPVPLPPQSAAQAAAAPAAAAPIQLSPPSTAVAGAPARTQ